MTGRLTIAITDFLVNSNLFISACGYFFTIFSCEALRVSSVEAYPYAWMVALAIFAVYGLQRLYYISIRTAVTTREKWYHAHRKIMWPLVVIAFLALIPFVIRFPFKLYLFYLPLASLSFLYYLGPFPLRNVFLLKGFLIGIVWAVACVVTPFYLLDAGAEKKEMLLLAAGAFSFVAALCVPFDIRDMEEDKNKNIRSLPVVYGIRASIITGVVLAMLFPLVLLLGSFSASVIFSSIITAIVTSVGVMFSFPHNSRFYFSVFIDGMLIVQFLVFRFLSSVLQ